jgi:hypothetical protein
MKTLARAADRDELRRRLRTVRPEAARRWGRLSAPQMVCHLADAFRMAIGHRAVALATLPLPRGMLRWFVLYAPIPWPSGIPTSPEIDPTRGGTLPAEFAADLAQVESLMDLVAAQAEAKGGQPHPVLGKMSSADWLRWGWLHTDHHLRQFGA